MRLHTGSNAARKTCTFPVEAILASTERAASPGRQRWGPDKRRRISILLSHLWKSGRVVGSQFNCQRSHQACHSERRNLTIFIIITLPGEFHLLEFTDTKRTHLLHPEAPGVRAPRGQQHHLNGDGLHRMGTAPDHPVRPGCTSPPRAVPRPSVDVPIPPPILGLSFPIERRQVSIPFDLCLRAFRSSANPIRATAPFWSPWSHPGHRVCPGRYL